MQTCPSCRSATLAGANFCGRCGAKLAFAAAAPVAVCRCGAGPESIDAAGFCTECGLRQIDADPRDHEELSVDADLGGVTDRGRRHPSNEDAIALAEGPSPSGAVRLLAVADGVSASSAAAEAAAAAVRSFRDVALTAVARGDDLADAAKEAANAAQRAVLAVPYRGDAPPATTLVAALVCGRRAVFAWAGDSRAYLLGGAPVQLTRDDSWYNEVVEKGALTPEQAKKHKYAHAIVNSLGGLSEGEVFAANFLDNVLPEKAIVLLCSDGFWNYAETPEAVAKLVPDTGDAVSICRELVAFANRQGGHDNISVVLLRLSGAD